MRKFNEVFAVTEKGKIAPAFLKAAREQVIKAFEADGYEMTPKGNLVIAVGTDALGGTVYVKVDFTVTNGDVYAMPKAVKADAVELTVE